MRDITSAVQCHTYTNTDTEVVTCQASVTFGNGSDDLDGSGGEFELTLDIGSSPVMPDTQYVWFGEVSRAIVYSRQFTLPVGETASISVKSPNSADTSVWVKACIYEIGIESLRTDISSEVTEIIGSVVAAGYNRTVRYEEIGNVGVYPRSGGRITGGTQ